jgi:DNA-binding HxlR family transcriptional regulator
MHDIVKKRPQKDSPYACYKLTNKGKDLFPIIHSMTQWGEKYTCHT